MKAFIVAGVAAMLCSGCAAPIPSYQVSVDPSAFRGLDKRVKVVSIAPPFKDDGTILCRGGVVVELPQQQSFTRYISGALAKELAYSGLLSEDAPLILAMKLERVDFSSALGATNWYIDARYEIEGQVMHIATVYNDRSSYFGLKACDNMAAYFQKAVATHFRQLLSEPALRARLGPAR